jgi:pimeloyl-ACP methyl ester carboxylesterase
VSAGGLRYDRYLVDGRPEWLMRIGPAEGVPLLLVPPLLEEMNRTRALLAAVMRRLAGEGFACTLPDLPGTGESERALDGCSWADWEEAVRSAAGAIRQGQPLLVASSRGGALIDAVPDAVHWRFSPVEGRSLLRDLGRSALTGGDGGAGYALSAPLSAGLAAASPAEVARCRTVRLATDPKPADAKLDGPALWRRSEPGTSPELAEAIATDILAWARSCANC